MKQMVLGAVLVTCGIILGVWGTTKYTPPAAAPGTLASVHCNEKLDCGEFNKCDRTFRVCRTRVGEQWVVDQETGSAAQMVVYAFVVTPDGMRPPAVCAFASPTADDGKPVSILTRLSVEGMDFGRHPVVIDPNFQTPQQGTPIPDNVF